MDDKNTPRTHLLDHDQDIDTVLHTDSSDNSDRDDRDDMAVAVQAMPQPFFQQGPPNPHLPLPSNANKRYRPAPAKTFQCRGYGECRMVFSRSEHLARHIRYVVVVVVPRVVPVRRGFFPSIPSSVRASLWLRVDGCWSCGPWLVSSS